MRSHEISRRGFVFTLDALFALIMLGMTLTIILIDLPQQPENVWLSKSGQDLLTALDKHGDLRALFKMSDSQALASINSMLSLLPSNMGGRLTITEYTASSKVFTLHKTLAATKGTRAVSFASSRRLFIDPSNNYYAIATLDMWYQ